MPRKPGAGNPYTKPRKTRSRVKPALPQGSTKPLDLIRNYNVERFQPDIYSGQTEHLAVVLRVESLTERSVTSARSNHMDDAEWDTNLIVVRARIVDSDMHAYMPTPMGDERRQCEGSYRIGSGRQRRCYYSVHTNGEWSGQGQTDENERMSE